MAMPVEIRIPQLGESITEGVLARWLVRDGDAVLADETVLEIETDKATMEIASAGAGRLEILEPEGSVVKPGEVVARIHEVPAGHSSARPAASARGGSSAPATADRTGPVASPAPAPNRAAGDARSASATETTSGRAGGDARSASATETTPRAAEAQAPRSTAGGATDRAEERSGSPGAAEPSADEASPLSPAVRRLVAEHALDAGAIAATGKGGRLTKEDVLRHIADRAPDTATPDPARARAPGFPGVPAEAERAEEHPPRSVPSPEQRAARSPAVGEAGPARGSGGAETSGSADSERVRMTALRRRIAERLVEAQRTAAILTTFNEVDMSAVTAARRQHRERFKARHGVDLGLVSIFARAVVLALGDVPIVNAAIDGDEIVQHRVVHLGIAVATPRGLVVPVVRHAERKDLAGLERGIAEMAALAREGKLLPDHLSGGTFTITNGGVFGSLLSTPILNPPQSGILGMHKIEERPVAVDGQVVIRPMMYVALSYDHRLVDGEQAVTFLVRVKERIEDPLRMLLDV